MRKQKVEKIYKVAAEIDEILRPFTIEKRIRILKAVAILIIDPKNPRRE